MKTVNLPVGQLRRELFCLLLRGESLHPRVLDRLHGLDGLRHGPEDSVADLADGLVAAAFVIGWRGRDSEVVHLKSKKEGHVGRLQRRKPDVTTSRQIFFD